MTYIDPALVDDENAVAQKSLARVTELDPEWVPAEGDPETIVIEAAASPIATSAAMLHLTARGAFAEVVGQRVARIDRNLAIAARAVVDVTLDTTAGYTVNAGADFTLTLDGDQVPFTNPDPIVVAPGGAIAHGIALVALDVGADLNGASSPARSGAARVQTVTVTTQAGGGADEEPEDAYLDRIVARKGRVHFTPVTAPQYAGLVIEDPSVARCAYFNRYDPATTGADAPGSLTLVPIDAAGASADDETVDRLEATPEIRGDDRPLNVTIHIRPANHEDIVVAITVQKASAEYGDQDVKDAVEAAVKARGSGGLWDFDALAPGLWTPSTKTFTALDCAVAAGALQSVRRVTAATVNGSASVSLEPIHSVSPVMLPNVTTVTVTIA